MDRTQWHPFYPNSRNQERATPGQVGEKGGSNSNRDLTSRYQHLYRRWNPAYLSRRSWPASVRRPLGMVMSSWRRWVKEGSWG